MDWQEPSGWPSDTRRDRLIGDWHIYQRVGGHRTSTDDLITAWYAVHRTRLRHQQPAMRYLDLGCGIGSVLLMTVHALRPQHALGVEAQPQSFLMAERAIAELPEGALANKELYLQHSDFRDVGLNGTYDLVTGSPPYFPLDSGVLPRDSQRRACRFEARGGIEAYCEAAVRALSPAGRFYVVFPTKGESRTLEAAAATGLLLRGRADFRMREDRPEFFLSVFEFSRSHEEADEMHRFECAVRDAKGDISSGYQTLRRELGVEAS